MSPSAENSTDLTFTEGQKKALLTLLTDDDPGVYENIHQTILAQGPAAAEWLQRYTLADDPLLRKRAAAIVEHFERQSADNGFLSFCLNKSEKIDVERGAWLLAKTKHSSINVEAYAAILDNYASELKDRIDFGAPAGQILSTINFYLYHYLGYCGDMESYYNPQNSYLNCVVDRLKGNPISLSAVYMFVCKRLHLPVVGIGMPGHFICRFQTTREQIYIDPFQKGKLMTKGECIKMLIQSGHDYHESFISPVSPRRMLLRMCSNLQHAYSTQDQPAEALQMQHYIIALSK
jgi:regulator of sirC expression with transglutaminase-like and TPR domain